MTFDARGWLATQLRVAPDELVLEGTPLPSGWSTSAVVRYGRAGRYAAQLVVSGQRRNRKLPGLGRRRVAAVWPRGESRIEIEPDEPIQW
jgi:hypothetical protein